MKKAYIMLLFILIYIVTLSAVTHAESITEKKESIDWFWVFYEKTITPAGNTFVLRPFYMEAADKEKLFQASLMPLFFWRYRDDRNDVTKGFFGFYGSDDYKHSDKKEDYDNSFFPLFFYGNGNRNEDKYLFIYPIGGDIRGKFAYQRISPYVFPGIALFFLYPPSVILSWQTLALSMGALIPVYTEFEDKDYTGTALFWPFITWGKGDKREDFRFLPFYAHNFKRGWYDNYSYLLLINYRELYLSDDVKHTFFFFPFYGKKWSESGKMKSHTILWPFFSWGYDLDKNEREYNLPWPLVQIGDSDKPWMKKRIFFPFWGKYETSTYQSMFVTPLYFRIKNNAEYFKSEYHITCIIAWYLKRDYSAKHEYYGNSWRYFKLWPLIQTEWSDSGLYGINLLSLLPFRDTAGYEKLYQPFWTLFEYRKKPDGEKHLGFLLRTYYQVWNDGMFKMKIPVIVNFEKSSRNLREFTILFGSTGYEKDKDGAYIKFLWIPLKIGDGDNSLTDNKNEFDNDSELTYNNSEHDGYNSWIGDIEKYSNRDKVYFKTDIEF